MARIVLVGEAMLELRRGGGEWRLGYGGDTLNTAIHLARGGHDVGYLTAIGGDPLSGDLKQQWAREGLGTDLVLVHPTRATGLYAIATNAEGERSFTYWRDASAAREMFALPAMGEALDQARRAELLAFSLISVAILPDAGRETLLALATGVRERGGRVAFDGNYRARLWASPEDARHWRDRAVGCADIGLTDADAVAAHWQRLGCVETVVKLGARGCRLPDGAKVEPDSILVPVDTSGAGDAFNAGYLGARMNGLEPEAAARAGHALAGWTIMRPGAIPARDA